MIGLSDLGLPDARSWEDADRRFSLPRVDAYNIAADCLRGPAEATALISVEDGEKRSVTFRELDSASARLALGLSSAGVGAGDRVAVKLSQSIEMATAVLAVLRLGAVLVPVSNVLGAEAVRYRLHDSQPKALIAAGSESEESMAADVGAVLVSAVPGGPGLRLQDLVDAATTSTAGVMARSRPEDPGLLMYTSGTTGKSKGVLHGHRVLLGHHAIDFALDHIRPDDVAYSPVDWAWAGGLLLGLLVPLAHGIPVVAHRDLRFDPSRILGVLRDCGVSVGLFPPTALRMLRQSGEVTASVARTLRLRCLVSGAEAVEPDLFEWARTDLGVSVNNAYGQTEANALIGHSSLLGALDPASLGRPYPGRRVAVLDADRHPVPAGETGQIAVRADDPVCMLGYWGAERSTADKVVDGWLLTGDDAHLDERGQVFFHGRSDDIIKSGGYRLGPAEVEAALLLHPRVADCAVVGLPDPVRGSAVTAYVRVRPGGTSDDRLTAELQRQVRATVGAHAYPRAVHYVTDLPRTSTGKVDRAALRRQGDVPAEPTAHGSQP